MNGFEKRAEQKKNDIFLATEKLLHKKSANDITVKDIAKTAKVSPVTIFKYFDTKENLIEETLLHYLKNFIAEIENIINSKDTFQNKLKKAMIFKSNEAKYFHRDLFANFRKYIANGDERFIYYSIRNKELTKELFKQGKKEGIIDNTLFDDSLELYMQLINQGISLNDNITKVIPLIDDIMNLICYGFAGNKD